MLSFVLSFVQRALWASKLLWGRVVDKADMEPDGDLLPRRPTYSTSVEELGLKTIHGMVFDT